MHVFIFGFHPSKFTIDFRKYWLIPCKKNVAFKYQNHQNYHLIQSMCIKLLIPPPKKWGPTMKKTHNLPSFFRGVIYFTHMWGGVKAWFFFHGFFGVHLPAGCTYRPPSAYVWEVMEESLVDCPAKKETIGGPRQIVTERWGPKNQLWLGWNSSYN